MNYQYVQLDMKAHRKEMVDIIMLKVAEAEREAAAADNKYVREHKYEVAGRLMEFRTQLIEYNG